MKMKQTSQPPSAAFPTSGKRARPWQRLLPWLITAACFAYLYSASRPRRCGRGQPAASLPRKKF